MPTIRVDDEVYSWLKDQAVPFEDTPNSVLRRIAGLNNPEEAGKELAASDKIEEGEQKKRVRSEVDNRIGHHRLTGEYLSRFWNVNVKHALYHQDGTFYENLNSFPGALFDFNGYVIFRTEQEYNSCSYLNIGQKLNVHGGISSIPGYKRMR